MSDGTAREARILVAPGARATEALLLERLTLQLEAARQDSRLLARPVRIVVPSRSLRDHLCSVLVRHFARAVAGVQVQTLHGLAREVLERCSLPTGPGEALLPVLVREAAKRESLLAESLGALHDGFGTVVGTVRDLLDAGFDPTLADGADDALVGLATDPAECLRARALVRVASAVATELEKLGIDTRTSCLRRAREALQRDPARALPQRAVWVHGFADATGVATDLIEALVRHCRASVLLDQPRDPADPTQPDLGQAFSARFRERLAGAARVEDLPGGGDLTARVTLLEAPGGDAEVRGVAVRVRALLDGGVAPESIGVVARTLTPYAPQLRAQLGRLGIPFSTLRLRGGLDGVGRRIQALLDLLERGGETLADRWLDALAPPGAGAPLLSDLRVALHALGAARLDQVAALDVEAILGEEDSLPLPVRHGIEIEDLEHGGTTPHARRRRVSRAPLGALLERARRVRDALRSWPEVAFVADHGVCLRELLDADLRWSEAEPARAPLLEAVDDLAQDLPAAVAIDRPALLLLLRDACDPLGSAPLGGAGAGVQVLDAIQARGRTFAHLFVLGLNRDVFPRIVLEDPLLSDSLRRALAERGTGVLPDLPIKLGGFEEERYLFAQLLSSSPEVTLSWQSVDDDGRERAVSTLVERLRLGGSVGAAERLPTLWSAREGAAARPADEHAVLAGLHGSRAAFARVLPIALAQTESATRLEEKGDLGDVARARLAALEALEPRGAARLTLGPAFGFVGARRAGDGRTEALAITTLEQLAACPWQTFLARVLHVEAAPDALEALPAVDAMLIGSVLHRTIESIVKAVLPGKDLSLEAALLNAPNTVAWPSDIELNRLLVREAQLALREEGVASPGLVRVLAERAAPLVREVYEQVWRAAEGVPSLLGAELAGAFTLTDESGTSRQIRFRADLVEALDTGFRLTDLKSGRPISRKKRETSRRKDLLDAVARGRKLQAVAYARAVSGEGRYLFADPTRSEGQPSVAVRHDEADFAASFEASLRTLLAAWDRGSFLPRLELPDGTDRDGPCRHCQLSEACVRGDTGARLRLRRWAADAADPAGAAALALEAARRVFQLAARTGAAASREEEGEA